MKTHSQEPIDLHFHDLRRSAHYQMRKASIDSQTRRDIMGHESTLMDDCYTMIDDEALEEARRKMYAFQRQRGLVTEDRDSRIALLEDELKRLRASVNSKQRSATRG